MKGRAAAAAALLLLSHPAAAEVYSWHDRATGEKRVSNIAPPWYRPFSPARGPRVVVMIGSTVIDDTALPIEKRFQLQRQGR